MMLTIGEFAIRHRVSRSLVLKWIRQQRVKAEKKGKLWLIDQTRRPKNLGYGGLTEQQRRVWPRQEPDLLKEILRAGSKKDPKFKKLVAAATRRRKALRKAVKK